MATAPLSPTPHPNPIATSLTLACSLASLFSPQAPAWPTASLFFLDLNANKADVL